MKFSYPRVESFRKTVISITSQVAVLLIVMRIISGAVVVDPTENMELLAGVASTNDYKQLCLLTNVSLLDPNREITPLLGTQQALHRHAGFEACNLVSREVALRLRVAKARSFINAQLIPELDREKQRELVRQGCEMVHELADTEPYARSMWSQCLFYGPMELTKDRPEAIRQALQAVDEGSSQSLYLLGQVHQFGYWVPASSSRSREYYKKSALLGNVEAEAKLSSLAHQDVNAAPPVSVVDSIKEAHERGSVLAANWLGRYFLAGHAGKENIKAAYPYLRESVAYPASAYYLATAYEEGSLKSNDSIGDAISFYTLAAANGTGYVGAYMKVAKMLEQLKEPQFSLSRSREAVMSALKHQNMTLKANVECVSFDGVDYSARHSIRLSNQVFGNQPIDDALEQLAADYGCSLTEDNISTLRLALEQANTQGIGFVEQIGRNRDTLQASLDEHRDQ